MSNLCRLLADGKDQIADGKAGANGKEEAQHLDRSCGSMTWHPHPHPIGRTPTHAPTTSHLTPTTSLSLCPLSPPHPTTSLSPFSPSRSKSAHRPAGARHRLDPRPCRPTPRPPDPASPATTSSADRVHFPLHRRPRPLHPSPPPASIGPPAPSTTSLAAISPAGPDLTGCLLVRRPRPRRPSPPRASASRRSSTAAASAPRLPCRPPLAPAPSALAPSAPPASAGLEEK